MCSGSDTVDSTSCPSAVNVVYMLRDAAQTSRKNLTTR